MTIAAASGMREIDLRLLEAASDGSCALVRELLEQGADPLAAMMGRTALISAAALNRPECVALLLPVSDPLAVDRHGASALVRAAWIGNVECVKLLLPCSDIDSRPDGTNIEAQARIRGFDDAADLIANERRRRAAAAEAREIARCSPMAAAEGPAAKARML